MGIQFAEAKELGKSRAEVAEAEIKYEEYKKEYNEHLDKSRSEIIGKVRKIYQDFEELCFSISKIDGQVTMGELTKKSVYDFYRYKQLLIKHLNKQKK